MLDNKTSHTRLSTPAPYDTRALCSACRNNGVSQRKLHSLRCSAFGIQTQTVSSTTHCTDMVHVSISLERLRKTKEHRTRLTTQNTGILNADRANIKLKMARAT